MRSEIKNISGKLDALTLSKQVPNHEGNFPKLIHKAQPKRSTSGHFFERSVLMCFFIIT